MNDPFAFDDAASPASPDLASSASVGDSFSASLEDPLGNPPAEAGAFGEAEAPIAVAPTHRDAEASAVEPNPEVDAFASDHPSSSLWESHATPESTDALLASFEDKLIEAGIAFTETLVKTTALEFLERSGIFPADGELDPEFAADFEEQPGLLVSKDYFADWSPAHLHEVMAAGAAMYLAHAWFSPASEADAASATAESESSTLGVLRIEPLRVDADDEELRFVVSDPLHPDSPTRELTADEVLVMLARHPEILLVPHGGPSDGSTS